jgi:cyanate permease
LAAVVSPTAFGIIADLTGSFRVPFIFSIGLLVVGIGLSFLIRADRPLIVDDVPDPIPGFVGVTR